LCEVAVSHWVIRKIDIHLENYKVVSILNSRYIALRLAAEHGM